jgi:transcription factor IIIB subunit 2
LTLCLIVQFIKLSDGLEGGADPPAFQRAEKRRFEAAKRAEEAAAVKEAAVEESLCDTQNSDVENTITPREVIATVQRNAHTMVSKVDILVQYVFSAKLRDKP